MRGHERVVAGQAVEQHLAVAQARQVGHLGVVGVEYARAFVQHHVDLGAQHARHLLGFTHVVVGQVFPALHVGHDADQAAVVGQAFLQDGACRGLHHGGLRQAVGQQAVRAGPVGGVGLLCLAVGQEHALAAGHARELARQLQQPAHQARDEGVALRAHNAHQRNAARAGTLFGARKQVVHDGHAHRARRAAGRLEVHQQARAGVHFEDGAALLLHGARHVLEDHVHAGDVQTDDLGRQLGVVGHVGVHVLGAVDGHVAVALQQDALALRDHAVGRDVLALQLQLHGAGFEVDPVQRVFLLGAAARVLVQHRHQFAQRGFAVAVHADRFALGGGHHLAAHHQQAVLHAVDEFLDDDLRALGFGQREGGLDFSLARELQRHAARVVAVRGLDGDGATDVLGHFPGFLGIGHHAALGHRHAAGSEQSLGEVLVLRNPFGDGAGLVAFCRPDAALRCAVAQLHQIAVVQADVRNAPLTRRIDDAARAGAQIPVVDAGFDGLDGGLEVKRLVVDGGHEQFVAPGQRGARHVLLGAAEHHAVHAALRDFACLAELGRHASEVQQLDDDVLQHMAHPGAAFQALDEAAALAHAAVVLDQRGQPGGQALIQAGQFVGGVVLQFA